MRIIGGKLKGKSISFLKSSTTRPLKDSIKENIFNILIHSNLLNINLEKSKVLDLYSGIGSFGLECISRGSSKIIFVEKDKNAYEILNKNLIHLSVQNKAIVVTDQIEIFLKKEQLIKFDIIFLDPPFADNTFVEKLRTLKEKKIFKKAHVVIIHREHKSSDNFKKIINPIIVKKYGRSKIIFAKF
tara:strand:- start:391 stop:948 length:558 start_codon:yes stop_codon:yes gene_type:complete